MGSSTIEVVRSRRSVPAAITLFFVAPFVAEYLIGDLSLKLLADLVVVAPMCGGAAVVIREAVRRRGRGWPTILFLSAAYALLAGATQSLFNSGCVKLLQVHFLRQPYAEWLGIGEWWAIVMLSAHAFWSTGIAIALAEGLFPERAQEPWLGKVGEAIFGVLCVSGLLAAGAISYKTNQLCATPKQLGVVAAVSLVMVVVAFLIPTGKASRKAGTMPSPWLTGVVALVLGVVVLLTSVQWGWVGAMLVVDAVFLLMVYVLSNRTGWMPLHTFSLAAGGALAYGLNAFHQKPFDAHPLPGHVGNVIFLAIAVVLIVVGARRTGAFVRNKSIDAST